MIQIDILIQNCCDECFALDDHVDTTKWEQ